VLTMPEWIAVAAALVGALVLARGVSKVPDGLVAYGRFLPTYTSEPNYLYVGEGMNSSIVVSELANGVRNFHVAGKVEASTEPQDMRLQRMLGHISALLHPNPQSVLVVGFGAGVTAGSFVLHPGIKRIVICEIEPLIPEVVSQYFRKVNYDVTKDPRVEIVYDDARHFILTTKEKFDVITSDPIHPWVKGAATLYTKEYFELVKRHLNPGGVITQWVPLYESHLDVVKSEVATFVNVFPNGTVWSNDISGKGYDVVLAGRLDPTPIDVDALQARLDRPDHLNVAQSLREVGFQSALSLLSTYAGQGPDLAPWLVGAELNTDRNLRLQYLAGFGLNSYQNASIYDDMLRYRRYPDRLFVATPGTEALLREALMRPEAE
jgi:spermidine synthase